MGENVTINSILKDITNKKTNMRKLEKGNNMQAYQRAAEELKKAETDLYAMLSSCLSNSANPKTGAFINALKQAAGKGNASETDLIIFNYMKHSLGTEGGFLVPEDIQTEVKALRNDGTNLESYVNVEPVIRSEGSRLIEVRADELPLEVVEEGGTIPEIEDSNIAEIKYKIKKRAGIIKITNELLSDTDNAVLKWLKIWLAKKTRATRNRAILDKISTITAGKEVAITTIKDLKAVVYKRLESYNDGLIVVTNSSGFDYLDSLVDEQGNKVLKSDIPNKQKLLFGLYPVKKMPDKVMKNKLVYAGDGTTITAYRYPIVCGDLKEAITLFDRENLSIDLSSNGDTFFLDLTKIKVRDRIAVEAVDKDALILAEVEASA